MLILTRRPNESIKIYLDSATKNSSCTVEFLSIKGNQIRLGFKAEKSVNIVRSEIDKSIEY